MRLAGFSPEQLAGAGFVGVGAAIVAGAGGTAGGSSVSPFFVGMYVVSMLFPAISSTLKERIFMEARKTFNGKELDVFVVNTCSSVAQVCACSVSQSAKTYDRAGFCGVKGILAKIKMTIMCVCVRVCRHLGSWSYFH